MAEDLPAELKHFIGQQIESLAQLEVLLDLRRHSTRQLRPEEVANRLALTVEMATSILADLVRRNLAVKEEAGFRYLPATERLGQLISILAETYQTRRLAVTNEIYSKPLEKVKTFADAFRFRKEK